MKQSWHPEVDGLRGLAVLLVILYHVGVPGFSGGFIGVDVFFVISGFLITKQLLAMRGEPIPALLKDFYARRARRILPSLTLVLLCTLALGRTLLLPTGEQQDLAKSAIAASAFASNLFFWKMTGSYFAGPTELQPLLHTWSLAVEEQFYLFWPLLIVLLSRSERFVAHSSRRRLIPLGIAAVTVLSLLISVRWTQSAPTAAFYLTPSRVWEIATGALIASIGLPRQGVGRSALWSTAGLIGILIAATRFSPSTPFPGFAAVLPVAGAALIVACSSAGEMHFDAVRRALRSRPLVECGTISYAWYLWHWPLLAIARAAALGNRDLLRDLGLAALSFGIAWCSTHYLETPIRRRQFKWVSAPNFALAAAIASLVLCISTSTGLWMRARYVYRLTLAPRSMSCLSDADALFSVAGQGRESDACVLSSGHKGPVYLIGDSHANHWSPAVAEWAQGSDVGAYERSYPGCPVLLAAFPTALPDASVGRFSKECREFSRRSIDELRSTARRTRTAAVVSIHWSYLADLSDGGGVGALAKQLDVALDSLDALGVQALLIGPTPSLDYSAPECMARRTADYCRLARSKFNLENDPIVRALASVVANHPADRFFDPTSTFCDNSWCYPSRNGSLLFRDKDHLSRAGAEAARGRLTPYLDWLMADPNTMAAAM